MKKSDATKEMYLEALSTKLRFNVQSYGVLSLERLTELPINQLDKYAVSLNKSIKESDTESFVTDKLINKELTDDKLRLSLVLDILYEKVNAKNKADEIHKNNEHNKRIMELIEKKKNQELEEKDIEELEKMLK